MTSLANDAATALAMWERYGHPYRLTLNCYGEDGYEVDALDDKRGCWVPVARGKDLIETMIVACGRVREMKPLGPITECADGN